MEIIIITTVQIRSINIIGKNSIKHLRMKIDILIDLFRNSDQRRSVYASDSHLMNSSGHSSSFGRPFVRF